jgi:microcystin degradation protein MlrC
MQFRSKRIAILGLLLESNRFAPVTVKEDYLDRVYLAGEEVLAALGKPESELPAEILGFRSAMDASCEWTPVPILVGLVEAGGPLDHAFYRSTLDDMRERLCASMPIDGVYIANHGAMITTESCDPDGEIFAMVRSVVGPDTPIVATLDLHGNVSKRWSTTRRHHRIARTLFDMLARGEAARAICSAAGQHRSSGFRHRRP